MNDSLKELRATVDQLVADGKTEGIESGGPLGRWLDAQAKALESLAILLEEQATRTAEAVARIEAAGKAEIEKLERALKAGDELAKHGELVLRQARQAQVASAAAKEEVVDRMVREVLPELADRLQPMLVIREQRWESERRWHGYVMAAVAAVALFMAGFGLSAHSNGGRVAAFDRCLSHGYTVGGHVYCRADQFFAGKASR